MGPQNGAAIRIDMVRQETNNPNAKLNHFGWASCDLARRHYATKGPAPIYKLLTLLWLHGHHGKRFQVWDNLSPYGNPGGLAMRGKVRNRARLVKGRPAFLKDALFKPEFSGSERELIAKGAGSVTTIDSPAPGNGRTEQSRPKAVICSLEGGNESPGGGGQP